MRASWRRGLWIALAFAAVLVVGRSLSPYYTGLLTEALILSVLAMSLNLLLGYTGLPSLGHAAFYGMGAYAAGIVAVRLGGAFWLCLLVGVAASALLAALYGLLALRTVGVYFLMITLALAQILWAIAFGWRSLTGGDDGLRGIKRPDLGLPGIAMTDSATFFTVTLIAFAVAALLMYVLVRSPFGHALRGIRESEPRMAALGYDVWLYKLLMFVLSGAFAGFAGVFYVYYKGFVSPETLSVVVSAEVLLMVILGGAGVFLGPVVGAAVIVLLSNFISAYTDRWVTILGAIYVLVVMLAPDGLLGAAAAWRDRRRARTG
jgi:branched-chain amino acid transport system permease protein